jgi:phosphotriesterase-related protein
MIRTVLGDISKDELGFTLAHEHLILDLDWVRKDGVSFIQDVNEVIPEIAMAQKQGIEAVFEVSTIDMKRDVKKLKEISERTGLKIVCSTGYYLAEYHPESLNEATPEEIAEVYIKELTEGIDGTDIRAGLIAEIASSPDEFVGNEKKILEAAAIASVKTGFAVSTHTGRPNAAETVEILLKGGVDPDKIIIGHQDLIDDHDYHLSLLRYGVNIAFDTCGKVAYMPDETRAMNALKLVEAGYEDHLLLSNDISRRTYFTSFGKQGYLAVMGSVVPLMREYGISEETIRKFLKDNPARIVNNSRI